MGHFYFAADESCYVKIDIYFELKNIYLYKAKFGTCYIRTLLGNQLARFHGSREV